MNQKQTYANGQKVWQLNGAILSYFFKNGQLKAQGFFANEQMIGQWKFYKENGSLWQIGHFENGQKHGKWTRFDTEGNTVYEQSFFNDKQI